MTLPAIGDPAYPSDLDELNRLAWVNGTANIANVTGVSSTETLLVTAPSFTYEANTAYQVQLGGLVRVSVANNSPMFQLRKTNVSGTTLMTQARWAVAGASATHGFNFIWHFQVGGSDVTAALAATVTGAGTYTTDVMGATQPTWINVYKVENATNLSWAPTLV